jgi:hypothetical protein
METNPIVSINKQLLEIRNALTRIQTKLVSIESLMNNTLKPNQETQELFTTLQVREPTLTEFIYALNTYLVTQGCVDAQLQITPNDYIKTLFAITDKISYANILHLLLLKLKIDMNRIGQYV